MTDVHENFRQALALEASGSAPHLSRLIRMQLPQAAFVAGVLALLAGIAYVDWMTGPDVQVSLFYAVPVLLSTWFVGRRVGYLMSLLAVGVELYADIHGAGSYTSLRVAFWNAIARECCLLLAVALLAALKDFSLRLGDMVDDRTKALRQLGAQLSQAEDAERRRLAHDIHDGFSQMLSVLKLNLAASLPDHDAGSPAAQRINDAIATVNELIQRSRSLTFDLHPAMLDHLGLVPTLRHFGEEFSRQTGIEVTVNEEGPARPLAGMAANYLFRSVKELVNNAAKHGAARQIVASIYWMPVRLRVVVDDDGGGFDPARVFAPQATKGLGLAAIHERLLSLGGSLRLESGVGKGTRVVLELPVLELSHSTQEVPA